MTYVFVKIFPLKPLPQTWGYLFAAAYMIDVAMFSMSYDLREQHPPNIKSTNRLRQLYSRICSYLFWSTYTLADYDARANEIYESVYKKFLSHFEIIIQIVDVTIILIYRVRNIKLRIFRTCSEVFKLRQILMLVHGEAKLRLRM